MHRLNSHARFARHSAEALGYGFRSLDGDDAYLFEVRDGMRRATFACGSSTPYALNSGRAYSLARDKSFATRVMSEAGLQVIPTRTFFATTRHAAFRAPGREPDDALAFSRSAQFPLFCKPNAGSRGELAEIVSDAAQFADYMARVAMAHDVFLVQPLVEGAEHRVFVLEDAALFAYRKRAPRLVGDGVRTVGDLLAATPAKPTIAQRSPASGLRFRRGDGALVPSDFTPRLGEEVFLMGRANRSAGGDAEAIIAPAPAALARAGLGAAAALGLRLAAIDVFDVSPARDLSDLIIIEANASPALETLEAQGRFDLIEVIWSANFAAALA
ncbi:MAG: hypothetical protein GC189_05630 [Alphaproteobacteria bacterium]|nr:hypothetical protein [Alphaproteobacteria bacterium]